MKIIIQIAFLFLISTTFAQESIKPIIQISEEINPLFGYTPFINSKDEHRTHYLKSSLRLGIQKSLKTDVINIFGSYQLAGNLKGQVQGFYQISHFAGVGFEYIFNKDKRFRPFIGLVTTSEFKTNYKNGYLYDVTKGYPISSQESLVYLGFEDGISSYFITYYHSTPFIGSIMTGCEWRIINKLYLRLSLVNDLQVLKTRTLLLTKNEAIYYGYTNHTISKSLKNSPVETTIMNSLGIQLGLSYAFSFKKKPKPETP